MNKKIQKSTLIVASLIIIVIFVTACANNPTGKLVTKKTEEPFKELSVRLPVPVMGAHYTQYFATVDQGFYKDEHLKVKFNLGSPDTNPIKMVLAKKDDIGLIGSPDTILVARSRGAPIKAIATFHKDSDFFVIITKKESNITSVQDLNGKKVGFFYGHSSTDIMRELFKEQKINVTEVNVGQDYSQFIAGNIDAQFAFRTLAPIVLESKGIEVNIISPKDYGITTNGLTLFATEETIKNEPETIEAFLRATFKGTEYTLNNREAALESILKREPSLDKELQLKELNEFLKPMSNSKEFPIGYMDQEMYEETYERLQKQGLLESEFNSSDAYTTEFLKAIYG